MPGPPLQTQSLQPPPTSWEPIIGPALYRWLVKFVKDIYTAVFPVISYDGPNGSLTVNNCVFSDNTPSAGNVQWSACTVTYQGITYQIPQGFATNAAPAIIWQFHLPNQFQAVGFPLQLSVDDFLIGQNVATGSPPAAGFFSRMLRFSDRTGAYMYMDETGIQGFNKNQHQTFFILRQTTDGVVGATCSLVISDGTGAAGQQQVALIGNIANGGGAVGGLTWTRACTFAQLPTVDSRAGYRATITDGAAYSFGAIAAGGGSTVQPVFWDGTNWRQG